MPAPYHRYATRTIPYRNPLTGTDHQGLSSWEIAPDTYWLPILLPSGGPIAHIVYKGRVLFSISPRAGVATPVTPTDIPRERWVITLYSNAFTYAPFCTYKSKAKKLLQAWTEGTLWLKTAPDPHSNERRVFWLMYEDRHYLTLDETFEATLVFQTNPSLGADNGLRWGVLGGATQMLWAALWAPGGPHMAVALRRFRLLINKHPTVGPIGKLPK